MKRHPEERYQEALETIKELKLEVKDLETQYRIKQKEVQELYTFKQNMTRLIEPDFLVSAANTIKEVIAKQKELHAFILALLDKYEERA